MIRASVQKPQVGEKRGTEREPLPDALLPTQHFQSALGKTKQTPKKKTKKNPARLCKSADFTLGGAAAASSQGSPSRLSRPDDEQNQK